MVTFAPSINRSRLHGNSAHFLTTTGCDYPIVVKNVL